MSSGYGWKEGLQIWRVAVNIYGIRMAGKGWPSSLGVGHVAKNPTL
jgi:hypothetical protein